MMSNRSQWLPLSVAGGAGLMLALLGLLSFSLGCSTASPADADSDGSGSLDQVELVRLAESSLRYDDVDTAIDAATKAVQTKPSDAEARYVLARSLSRGGDTEAAIEVLETAILAGMLDFQRIEAEADFAALRGKAAFERILSEPDAWRDRVAARQLEGLRLELGPQYRVHLDAEHRLLIATNRPEWMMAGIIEQLTTYAEAQWGRLFRHRPTEYLTIVIPSEVDFRKALPNTIVGGAYIPKQRLLLAKEPDYTLRHEFTHFLHFSDLDAAGADQALWFLEAVATLYENSVVRPSGPGGLPVAIPMPNERQNLLKALQLNNELVPWRILFSMSNEAFMKDAPANYAMARYIAFWLHEQGRLETFHRAYIETAVEDPSGMAAMKAVFDRPVTESEAAWREWVEALPSYAGLYDPNRPRLGVRVLAMEIGLQVVTVEPESPAANAGVRPGDVLRRIGGRPVLTQEDLLDELLIREPGDELELQALRGDAMETFTLTLDRLFR